MHYDREGAPAFVFDMIESERPKVDRAVLGFLRTEASGGFHDRAIGSIITELENGVEDRSQPRSAGTQSITLSDCVGVKEPTFYCQAAGLCSSGRDGRGAKAHVSEGRHA